MIFNSLEFFLFFPITTALYFLCPHRYRWALLLLASCLFYMAFVPAYILILFLTITVDYIAALLIEKSEGRRRKAYLIGSIVATCAILVVFKYYNFFIGNYQAIADLLGWNYSVRTLEIILPIGLSFHTFQSLSYVIEVYRGHQKPERHFGIYSVFVMFYPQLVAGPIERPQNLLHQFRERHTLDFVRIKNGLLLMLWGMFKKVVIADRLALFVDLIYGDPGKFSAPVLALATVFFAFQIYCDFSGYSDIARGAARVMGFELMINFNRPYVSRSVSEFWRRWHISLSTWFKDYVYVPLGGSRRGTVRTGMNLLVTFLISGFWHGASWTFVIWGGLNGLYLVSSIFTKELRASFVQLTGLDRAPRLHDALKLATTFTLICLAWIFFRANSLADAFSIVEAIGTWESWQNALQAPLLDGMPEIQRFNVAMGLTGIFVLLGIEALQGERPAEQYFISRPAPTRWALYYALAFSLAILGVSGSKSFIYFQF